MNKNNEYQIKKDYLLNHNVTDSFPEMVDRFFNDTLISHIGNYIVEVSFDDEKQTIIYHKIHKRVNGEFVEIDSINSAINEIRMICLGEVES